MSRSEEFSTGQVDPVRGQEFGSLTANGQAYYVDRRSSGDDHDRAYALARHSYGERPSGLSALRHPVEAKRTFLDLDTVEKALS